RTPATSAYFLTNFAVCGVSPAMSCHTSTCASHRGPAPIPTVGTDRLSVTRAANSAGTHSSTTENAPAASRALAPCSTRRPSSPRAVHRSPAEGVHRLRGQPQVRHYRDAGLHQLLDLVYHSLAALEFDRVRTGLLEEPARGGQRLARRDLVRAERQVRDDHRP